MKTPVYYEFTEQTIDNPIYKNKLGCWEFHDCIIDLREFGKHPEYDQNNNLKVYSDGNRIRKYINRHPKTNALWYEEKEPVYEDSDFVTENINIIPDEEVESLFFCYDYLEWQYSHFLTDVFPKMWYYPHLKEEIPSLKFGQIRPIINFAWNLNDKSLNTKLNLISEFAHDITDYYLRRHSTSFFPLDIGKSYFVKKLFIPVPYTSQDVIGWPSIQLDMYSQLETKAKKIETPFYKKIYISRKDTVKNGWFNLRYCVNEDELIKKLENKGYTSLELMNFNIFEKIKIFYSANSIVQTVGSNCFNILFVRPGTMLYTILHPHYVAWSPMLTYLSTIKHATFVPYTNNIEMLGLGDYPDNYKREPDQPWKLNNIDEFTKLLGV